MWILLFVYRILLFCLFRIFYFLILCICMCLCVDLHMLSGVDEKVGEDNASSGDKDGHETSD